MYVYLAIALLSAALSFTGAWKVQSWRHAAMEADRLEQAAKETARKVDKIDVAAVGHETDKTSIRTVFRTITKEVAHVVEKPVYRNVCLDADGLRVLSTAINGGPTASVTAGGVPEPKRTD
jgi:hypothetical protein